VLNITYAATLTADSRGTGENSVIINAQRLDNNQGVKTARQFTACELNQAFFSQTAALPIGRVFEDKNFTANSNPVLRNFQCSRGLWMTPITTDPKGFSLSPM